jgi:hypothetical protein
MTEPWPELRPLAVMLMPPAADVLVYSVLFFHNTPRRPLVAFEKVGGSLPDLCIEYLERTVARQLLRK